MLTIFLLTLVMISMAAGAFIHWFVTGWDNEIEAKAQANRIYLKGYDDGANSALEIITGQLGYDHYDCWRALVDNEIISE
jgi:hypothetical protein